MPETDFKSKLIPEEVPIAVDNTFVAKPTIEVWNKLEESRQKEIEQQQREAEMRRRREAAAKRSADQAKQYAHEETSKLLNNIDQTSEDAVGIYETFATPEDLETMEKAKGVGVSVAMLPFAAGTTGGWIPGITSTIGGYAGGYVGSQYGQRLGQYLDTKYRWNTTPWLTFGGGLVGGALGGGIGAKGGMWAADQYTINKAFRTGQLQYGDDVIKVTPKINNPGFINLVDDAIQERQPLTMQRSPQFWTGTSRSQLTRAEQLGLPKHKRDMFTSSLGKSKITPEEKIGIPKGERNNGKYNGITFFRTLDVVPGIDDAGFVQVSSPHSLFSNFTTDNLVHTHSRYPSLKSHVIAVSPEAFRGSSLISTEPSDMFFINNTLKIKPKHITFISGDPEALASAKSRGFNTMTSPELQLTFKRGRYASGDLFPKPRLTKHSAYGKLSDSYDNWNAYKDLLRETVTTKFSRPTFDVYKKISNQTGLPISVKPFSGKNFPPNKNGVTWFPSDFRHVVYDPASPIESIIKEKYDIPVWMGSLFGSSDFEKSLINFRLSKLKQSVTPLKNGGTIK